MPEYFKRWKDFCRISASRSRQRASVAGIAGRQNHSRLSAIFFAPVFLRISNSFCLLSSILSPSIDFRKAMPPQNQEIAEFWHRWEEYFTAKGRKDPRIWAQAAICLGKLQEL